jgi:hypothetical protein
VALPYLFECNFEDGTSSPFDSETDTESKLSVEHYTTLAKLPFTDSVPYRGAYAALVDLSLGTADAYYQENTGFDVAANTAAACRVAFWLSSNLVMAASDTFDLLLWQSAGPVNEFSMNIQNNAGVITFRAGDTGGATFRTAPITLNTWHIAELVINTGTGADGTCTVYLDGYQLGAQITGIASGALTQARLGTMNIDAGTTRGRVLFDHAIADDTRVGHFSKRFDMTRFATKSGHVLLGPGSILEADLIQSVAVDETATLYDTDVADTTDQSRRVVVFQAFRPIFVNRGLYAVLTGTNPVLSIKVKDCLDMSEGGIKNIGVRHP